MTGQLTLFPPRPTASDLRGLANRPTLRVLDLFSGVNGWGDPFRVRGHDVVGIDIEPRCPATIHADLLTFDLDRLPWRPDVILASPPCEGFSVMNIGRNWFHDGTPKTDTARLALRLVQRTIDIVSELNPTYWVMENPRDKLRALSIVSGLERRTVTYCQFGESRMKPTDLWSDRFPPSLDLAPPCNNGDPCHVRAPRGSTTGTQGFGDYWTKGKVPVLLSTAFAVAFENDCDVHPFTMDDEPDDEPLCVVCGGHGDLYADGWDHARGVG